MWKSARPSVMITIRLSYGDDAVSMGRNCSPGRKGSSRKQDAARQKPSPPAHCRNSPSRGPSRHAPVGARVSTRPRPPLRLHPAHPLLKASVPVSASPTHERSSSAKTPRRDLRGHRIQGRTLARSLKLIAFLRDELLQKNPMWTPLSPPPCEHQTYDQAPSALSRATIRHS